MVDFMCTERRLMNHQNFIVAESIQVLLTVMIMWLVN